MATIQAAAPTGAAYAGQQDDESVLRALWTDPGSSAGILSDGFLRQVPLKRLEEIVDALHAECGGLRSVDPSGQSGRFLLTTVRCEIATTLRRDRKGRIIGLWFSPPARRGVPLEEALDAMKRFEGAVSYVVLQDGKPIAGHAQDMPLAVGSAFKLIVLAALLERIEAGKAAWSDTVSLASHHVSLSTGRLRRMPPGSPITLHMLAAFMIAESDNTAADALIAFIGRDRLEAVTGLSPFLTTREVFLLKSDESLYRRYAAADTAGRRELLEGRAELPLPDVHEVARPLQPEAEWTISTADLCAWIDKVAHLEITRINPGPIEPSHWKHVAFKGGSEIGVLNLTTHVGDEAGRELCVSATWNALEPLDDGALMALYSTLFQSLAGRP